MLPCNLCNMFVKFVFATLTLTLPFALGADPCFDIGPDPETGNYAACMPSTLCTTFPVDVNVCDSYPIGHVCCYMENLPGREHRGVWIASVTNMDWPKDQNAAVAQQQADMTFMIDQIEAAGMNAVYFQVRPVGDALYQSDIEPWSVYLTGRQGQAPVPLWDPLQYIIDYCKPKGIEVHAWINPYRANYRPTTEGLAPNHWAIQFPQYAYIYGSYLWMDPGAAEVQNRTVSVSLDLVSRYDLDGLHMDDYFYPYPETGIHFPDNETYASYLESNGTLGLGDWRRDNVNRLVRRLNIELHQVKPWIKFSVSPFGLHRPGHPEGMPSPITGFDPYEQIYADAQLWLQEGWVDMIIPQLYWRIDPPQQSYPVILDWWVSPNQNRHGRMFFAGMYTSRLELQDWPLEEIGNQVAISRQPANRFRSSWGNVHFNATAFIGNIKNLTTYLRSDVYRLPAFQPVYTWLSNSTYQEILETTPSITEVTSDSFSLSLHSSLASGLVHQIGIYSELDGKWSLKKIISVEGVTDENSGTFKVDTTSMERGKYGVTVVNRFGEESKMTFFDAIEKSGAASGSSTITIGLL